MYIADLHIHSRYSRATSHDCTPEYLDLWARKKGIEILGTGDFTHPAWREELREKLVNAEEGLYLLREEYRVRDGAAAPGRQPRFVVTGEISSIYKKNGKVRKVHSLILLPSLEDAELLSRRLETIGNIHSDGRPILGLDCRDLLEITLELCPGAVFIPAHIWTPHFSLFGAFSGFDTIEECFGDLTPFIHAMETGLSSDPAMNWRLSALDGYQLVSNSDAHSPSKLGREANLLDIQLSYSALAAAVETGEGLAKTLEFFPEEGKYHFDGHRKCHLCLSPSEAEQYLGVCPVCKKRLTTGVLHRVEQLADREEGYAPPGGKPYESIVPLAEVIAASTNRSAASVKVLAQYESMLGKLGPEFSILRDVPLEDIRKAAGILVAEGISHLREGVVERSPGFDGEYGKIRLLTQWDIDALEGQLCLFTGEEQSGMAGETSNDIMGRAARETAAADASAIEPTAADGRYLDPGRVDFLEVLNEEQRDAVTRPGRGIAVSAGPGTGKTRTLVSRVLYLIRDRGVKPSEITAVTFTNRAASELRARLESALNGKRAANSVQIGTFHSICHHLLKEIREDFTLADECETLEIASVIISRLGLKLSPKQFLREISLIKSDPNAKSDRLSRDAVDAYQDALKGRNLLDFDDLQLETLRLLKEEKKDEIRKRHFSYLLVDEFQDVSQSQYDLIAAWNRGGKELFVIGDPDQSIYSFRGANAGCFRQLSEDYPDLATVNLVQNYRSTPEIVSCALASISSNSGPERRLEPVSGSGAMVRLVTAPSDLSEAIFIAKEINRLIGGIDMLDSEGGPRLDENRLTRGFGDIAVLYRTHRQAGLLEKCLRREGIPYVVAGRDDFLTERTVRGAVCFFRSLWEPSDSFSRELCMKLLWNAGAGDTSKKAEDKYADLSEKYRPKIRKGKPQIVLEEWMKDMELEEDDPLGKLVAMAVLYKDMDAFLLGLTFGQEGDLRRLGGVRTYSSDTVTLATLHGAKGLEFPVVFLYGMRKGTIPFEPASGASDVEEERRLFFVGLTRAMNELILLSSGEESPFVGELPKQLVSRESSERRRASAGKQLSLFDMM